MITLTKDEQQQCDKVLSKISLEKDKELLRDHVVNLSKCMVDLSKKASVDLCGKVARVVVAIDYSGSMYELYTNGTIQQTLNRLVPLGLSFDDNGELDVFLFENWYRKFPSLTLKNYVDYQKEVIDTSDYEMGGTQYSPVIQSIVYGDVHSSKTSIFSKLFSRNNAVVTNDNTTSTDITYVIFITDGEPSDTERTDDLIKETAKTNTFIQFIGIGDCSFKYLRHLDDLEGRVIDNTGFFCLNNLNTVSDSNLYNMMLEEFAGWLKAKRL